MIRVNEKSPSGNRYNPMLVAINREFLSKYNQKFATYKDLYNFRVELGYKNNYGTLYKRCKAIMREDLTDIDLSLDIVSPEEINEYMIINEIEDDTLDNLINEWYEKYNK